MPPPPATRRVTSTSRRRSPKLALPATPGQSQTLKPPCATACRVQASLDGNTVELATEQTAFAENAVNYRASLSFLTGRIQTIMAALKGGE